MAKGCRTRDIFLNAFDNNFALLLLFGSIARHLEMKGECTNILDPGEGKCDGVQVIFPRPNSMQVISSRPNFKDPPLGSVTTGAPVIMHHDLSVILESQRGYNDATECQR